MKVILLTEVKNKGGEGDVVDVAPGFANNYLLPQGMAVLATKGNLKQLEQRKHNIAAREENRIADANKMKAQLEALTVKVEVRVGEEGVLFGSVTAQMVADAVKAQADLDIDRRRVEIKNAIKSAGELCDMWLCSNFGMCKLVMGCLSSGIEMVVCGTSRRIIKK